MRGLAVVVAVLLAATPAATQWLRHPTADIPRANDGRPNLRAPAPRTPQGRPVISGLWRPGGAAIFNIAAALKPGETIPYQPWAQALAKERAANNGRDDPTANCIVGGVPRSDLVPYPFKILETPGLVIVLYEAIHSVPADLHRRPDPSP